MDNATALARLRALVPQGSYDFNHLYFGSAAAAERTANTPARAATPAPLRIGLIDSGVAGSHPALRDTELHAWGCARQPVPAEPGTAIASRSAGRGGGHKASGPVRPSGGRSHK